MHCNFTIAMLENDILLTVECHVTLMNSRGPTFTDLANESLFIYGDFTSAVLENESYSYSWFKY